MLFCLLIRVAGRSLAQNIALHTFFPAQRVGISAATGLTANHESTPATGFSRDFLTRWVQ